MQVEGGGSCRDGFGGAIRQFRNPTKSCGWKAKGARSEQLMQVEAGGSCRDGFGGAIRQFRNPTTSCGWKAKGARSEQLAPGSLGLLATAFCRVPKLTDSTSKAVPAASTAHSSPRAGSQTVFCTLSRLPFGTFKCLKRSAAPSASLYRPMAPASPCAFWHLPWPQFLFVGFRNCFLAPSKASNPLQRLQR